MTSLVGSATVSEKIPHSSPALRRTSARIAGLALFDHERVGDDERARAMQTDGNRRHLGENAAAELMIGGI